MIATPPSPSVPRPAPIRLPPVQPLRSVLDRSAPGEAVFSVAPEAPEPARPPARDTAPRRASADEGREAAAAGHDERRAGPAPRTSRPGRSAAPADDPSPAKTPEAPEIAALEAEVPVAGADLLLAQAAVAAQAESVPAAPDAAKDTDAADPDPAVAGQPVPGSVAVPAPPPTAPAGPALVSPAPASSTADRPTETAALAAPAVASAPGLVPPKRAVPESPDVDPREVDARPAGEEEPPGSTGTTGAADAAALPPAIPGAFPAPVLAAVAAPPPPAAPPPAAAPSPAAPPKAASSAPPAGASPVGASRPAAAAASGPAAARTGEAIPAALPDGGRDPAAEAEPAGPPPTFAAHLAASDATPLATPLAAPDPAAAQAAQAAQQAPAATQGPATPGPAPAVPLAPPHPVRSGVPVNEVPVEIGLRTLEGVRRFDIRLSPERLGEIAVSLELGDEGRVAAHLVVERPETLALLRRDVAHLERALEQAGFKPAEGGVAMTLRDPGQDAGGAFGQRGERGPGGDGRPAQPAPAPRLDDEGRGTLLATRTWSRASGVDLKI